MYACCSAFKPGNNITANNANIDKNKIILRLHDMWFPPIILIYCITYDVIWQPGKYFVLKIKLIFDMILVEKTYGRCVMKNIQINDVSFSMLRGGLLVVITLLYFGIIFLERVDNKLLYTYNYAVWANMFVGLIPLVLIVTVLPAFYLELQVRKGRM